MKGICEVPSEKGLPKVNLRARVEVWSTLSMEGLPESSPRDQVRIIQAPSRALTPWISLLPPIL